MSIWTIIGLLVMFQVAQTAKNTSFNLKHFLVFGPFITLFLVAFGFLEAGVSKLAEWADKN